nr:hypothetical protein [Halomonas socia]
MILNLIERIKFNKKYGNNPTVEQFIEEWSRSPETYFYGYFDQELKWSTCYGLAQLEGLPDTHGYSMMPDIRCQYNEYKYSLEIGYIEGISMHSGGVVRIRHFALNTSLTRAEIGERFFYAILQFFKSKNAVTIEFHESHGSKIDHYRRFLRKSALRKLQIGYGE